jgi:chromosome segregation ATPase
VKSSPTTDDTRLARRVYLESGQPVQWSHLGGLLTAVLTGATIIVGTLLGLQRGRMGDIQARAGELSQIANDLRGRIGDLEKELARQKLKAAETEAELRGDLATLHVENEILKELNAQSVDWNAVTDLLEHHHSAAEGHWTDLDRSLTQVQTVLSNLHGAIERQGRQIDDLDDTES